jgi:nucleotide-binding universal stress UspA family protein
MAYRHILVPFDASPLAECARGLGAWLAWRGGGELDLVRAMPRPSRPLSARSWPAMAEREARRLAESKTELSLQAARLREKGVTATGAALPGEAVHVLLDYVERLDVDLVVMGTHGRSLPARWLLGGVASQVARRCPVPVILVPREARPAHDDDLRVLVALDGSSIAETALNAVLALAETVPTDITVFQVLPGPSSSPNDRSLEWYEEPVLGVDGYLEAVQADLARQDVNVRRAYSAGPAGDEIVQFIARGGFDLVAVGTRGLACLDRLIWGSVAEQLVRRAPVPILVTSPSMQAARQPARRLAGTGAAGKASAPLQMRYLG